MAIATVERHEIRDPESGSWIDIRREDGIVAYSLNGQPFERADFQVLKDDLELGDGFPPIYLFGLELLRRFINFNKYPADTEEDRLP